MPFSILANAPKKVLLFALLFLGCFNLSYAADLVFSPSESTHAAGETFTVSILVSNNTESINAVSGSFSYSADILDLLSISKTGSIINMWADEPSYGNGNGSFEGVILNPGFDGSTGKALTLTFKAKKEGTGTISFSSGSILANDGNATDVLRTLGSARYAIGSAIEEKPLVAQEKSTPVQSKSAAGMPSIHSDSYPREDAWYKSRNASFSWEVPQGVTAVRTLYDAQPDAVPSKTYDPPISSKTFTTESDGIFYMLVQFKYANGWGGVAHRKFQVDTRAPQNLSATSLDGEITNKTNVRFLVTATDTMSGMDHVSIGLEGSLPVDYPVTPSNTYVFNQLPAGKHTLTIVAFDKAGNHVEESVQITREKIDPPTILDYTHRTESEKKITVSGTTYPNRIVEVVFIDEDKELFSDTVKSDADGSFVLTWSKKLGTGVYDMRARVLIDNDAMSDYTDPRTVVIEHAKLIQVGAFIVNWLSLILILILAGTLIAATLWYSFLQFSRFRRGVHRAIRETENTLKLGVVSLRRDVEEFNRVLARAKKKRELTKEEEAIMKKFKKHLDQEIEKKLEEIR